MKNSRKKNLVCILMLGMTVGFVISKYDLIGSNGKSNFVVNLKNKTPVKMRSNVLLFEAPLNRTCGSPAIDGYAHVDTACLENSSTAKQWWKSHPKGGSSGQGMECNREDSVSIDGLAVAWGLTNKKNSPEECCQACRDHVPGPHVGGPFQNLPCNVWVFCPDDVCFEADAHHHTKGDCWLKFSEAPQNPEINARGDFSESFLKRHPESPKRCQWISGILVPPGQVLTNGTWGPRASW